MRFIFCCDPLNTKSVDVDYRIEFQIAKSLGFIVEFINLEDLLENNVNKAINKIVEPQTVDFAIYRGWMLKPEIYEILFKGLLNKKITLINSPEQYLVCHYFPNAYNMIKNHTPFSTWFDINSLKGDMDEIHKNLAYFNNQPSIIKDYVKSRKHEWEEACFIPDASDRKQVEFVVNNFIERQGKEINGGIVFRKYVNLEKLAIHPKSGMPLSKEFRLFFLNNELLFVFDYWEEATYDEEKPELSIFSELARNIKSKFFTMDIGKTVEGEWIVIEVGDGQVSGLPENADIKEFYSAIQNRLV